MYMVKRTWQVFQASRETAKYDYDGVRCIWSYSRYLCRTEPRSRENGPGKVGGEMHTGHDISLECDRNGSRLFWRKIYDMAVYRSV